MVDKVTGARVTIAFRTLSKKPWFRFKKEFVEGDNYKEEIRITNEGSDPFPPSDMALKFRWTFPTGMRNRTRIQLNQGDIPPGSTLLIVEDEHKVLAPGFALLELHYTPYGQGCVLYDSEGKEIKPLDPKPLAHFRGVAIMELRTLAALYLAAISSMVAAIGFLLNLLFNWIPQIVPFP